MSAPEWIWQAVIYQVFIDRFCRPGGWERRGRKPDADQPEFCGGNLEGIRERLDYIAELGANTIWLSPFNRTAAYHGYHIADFFGVDPRFGGERALAALVRDARARGIRLIMDFVPNHVHVSHPFFQAALKDRRSRYRRWFYFNRRGGYLRYLDFDELPKLNLDHPEARVHLMAAAKHWLDRGIDGLRLDHALGPSMHFWRAFRETIKAQHPQAALIGEVCYWGVERRHLATLRLPHKQFYFAAQELGFDVLDAILREYAEVLDGLLDFQFQRILRRFVANSAHRLPTAQIRQMLEDHYAHFPRGCCLPSFLDNHDLNRFLFEAGGDEPKLRRALEIQFSQAQPPIIYYGTEAGMSQTSTVEGSHGDLRARQLMHWPARKGKLFQFYQELISERKLAVRQTAKATA